MKQINEIEGLEKVKEWYYITTCGKVISIMSGVAKILKAGLNSNGYEQVILCTVDGKSKCMRVHRLVALAFIIKIDNKSEVNHIDEVKTHNYVNNLEWVTRKENVNHGTRNKRQGETTKGDNHYMYGKKHTEETKSKISASIKGDKNPKSKPIEYYEKNSTQRSHFKVTCKIRGWNFNDFVEIDSGEKCGNTKKYYYIYKNIIDK